MSKEKQQGSYEALKVKAESRMTRIKDEAFVVKIAEVLKCLPSYFVGGNEHIIEAAITIQANLAKYRWILVKERVPDSVITVWILLYAEATHSLHPGQGFYGEDENGWGWTVLGDTLLTEVYAWKSFDRDNYPALPKREGYE